MKMMALPHLWLIGRSRQMGKPALKLRLTGLGLGSSDYAISLGLYRLGYFRAEISATVSHTLIAQSWWACQNNNWTTPHFEIYEIFNVFLSNNVLLFVYIKKNNNNVMLSWEHEKQGSCYWVHLRIWHRWKF